MDNGTTRTEIFVLNGEEIIAKIKNLIHEGNARRIIIKNEEGRVLLEIPLAIGLVGAAFMPVIAAVGALAALAAKLTLVIERVETPEPEQPKEVEISL